MNGLHGEAVGRAGADAEISVTGSGKVRLRFRLAVEAKRRDDHDETLWLTVTLWEDLARTMDGKVKKGQRLYVEGRVRQDRYKRRNGTEAVDLAMSAWRCEPAPWDDAWPARARTFRDRDVEDPKNRDGEKDDSF